MVDTKNLLLWILIKKQNRQVKQNELKEEEQNVNHIDEVNNSSEEHENEQGKKYLLEIEEYKTKYARALADYQNLEKRVGKRELNG